MGNQEPLQGKMTDQRIAKELDRLLPGPPTHRGSDPNGRASKDERRCPQLVPVLQYSNYCRLSVKD
jgi:hypothetical protein